MRSSDANAAPSRVGDPHVAPQTSHAAAHQPEARGPGILLALVEEQLHPDAQAKDRDPAVVRDPDDRVEAQSPQLARAVPEVSDARKDEGPRCEDLGCANA